MHTLIGATVTLQPLWATDAKEMHSVLGDPSIYRYLEESPPAQDELERRYKAWERRGSPDGQEIWLNWVVRVQGEATGYVQSTVYRSARADIAYVFGSTWWGKSVAFEACQLMLGELHQHYGVQVARAVTRIDNLRSVRLLTRLGFTPQTDEVPSDDVGEQELAWTLVLPSGVAGS